MAVGKGGLSCIIAEITIHDYYNMHCMQCPPAPPVIRNHVCSTKGDFFFQLNIQQYLATVLVQNNYFTCKLTAVYCIKTQVHVFACAIVASRAHPHKEQGLLFLCTVCVL